MGKGKGSLVAREKSVLKRLEAAYEKFRQLVKIRNLGIQPEMVEKSIIEVELTMKNVKE